jgi:hypothetical protein
MVAFMSDVWTEIARQYAEGVPVAVMAKRFNVSRARITRRAKKLGWVRGAANGGHAGPHAVLPDKQPGSSQEEATASASDQRAALLARHKAAWAAAYGLRDEAFRLVRGEAPALINDLEISTAEQRLTLSAQVHAMFRRDASALMVAQEGERRAYGVCYKQQQEAGPEDEAAARRRRELAASILDTVKALRQQADRCSCTKEASD